MLSLRLPSTPESVSRAVEAVEAVTREAGLSAATITRVGLAVAEAVANAIEHGNENDPAQTVSLAARRLADDAGLVVLVEDAGPGVDGSRIANATLPDDPLQTDGRGLFLIKELSDGVEVSGSAVTLHFVERASVA